MKKIAVVLFCIAILCFYSGKLVAQENTRPGIASVVDNGNLVEFTITSSKKFIYGNNRYVLHIGDKTFFRNRQSYDYDKHIGNLTFLIDKADFEALENGRGLYLTYGRADENEQALEEFSKNNFPNCWPLGKFNKDVLSK